jgi:hypothetical protein
VTTADRTSRQLESAAQLTMFEPPLWLMLRDGSGATAETSAPNTMSELVVSG